MFRKTLMALAAFMVLVIAAALIAPYFVGGRAEATFRADVAAFDARYPKVQLTVMRYHRGFYSSEAVLDVHAGGGAGGKRLLQLLLGSGGTPELHVRINHGPIAIGAFSTHFSLTPVLYTAQFRADKLPALSVLGALKPEFYDEAWLSGGSRLTVDVPPGRIGLGVFGARWKGGHVVAAVNAARDRITYSGHVEPVRFQAMNPRNGATVSGTLETASWEGRSRRGRHGLWGGRGTSRVEGLAVSSVGAAIARIGPARASTDTGESHDGRWYHWHTELAQAGGTVRGWKWRRLALAMGVDKLDAAGLARALQALRQSASATQPSQMAMLLPALVDQAVMPQSTGQLHVVLSASEGTAEADGALDFAATAPVPAGGAASLTSAHGQLTVVFPRTLVTDFAAQVLGPEAAGNARQSLDVLLDTGYLRRGADGRYRCDIVWTPQGLTVNGLPLGAVRAPPPAATAPGL